MTEKNVLKRLISTIVSAVFCVTIIISSGACATQSDLVAPEGADNKEDFLCYSALAVGDVHIKTTDGTSLVYFKETMEYVRNNGIKLFISNGDFVHFGDKGNYDEASRIISQVFEGVAPQDMPEFIFNMGNHEFYRSDGCDYDESDYDRGFALFKDFTEKWMKKPVGDGENVFLRTVGGINYIAAWSSLRGKTGGESLAYEDFEKLEKLLCAADTYDKPCVVLTHFPLGLTYGGKADLPPTAVVNRLKKTFVEHPSVIHLTSHTHFSSLHDRTIDQADYTTIALGAQVDGFFVSGYEFDENGKLIKYANVDERERNRFVGDVHADALYEKKHFGIRLDFGTQSVTVKRVDLGNGEEYAQGYFEVPYGITKDNKHDKFLYEKGEREGDAVSFDALSSLSVDKEISGESVTLTLRFRDVADYYAVEGYKTEIFDGEGTLLKRVWWQSLFWADVKDRSDYTIITDAPASARTVKVYPMDFYGRYGKPLTAVVG